VLPEKVEFATQKTVVVEAIDILTAGEAMADPTPTAAVNAML
jgi:hypothetical protein